MSQNTTDHSVEIEACRSLSAYVKCLHTRIRYFQDPVVYTSKQGLLIVWDIQIFCKFQNELAKMIVAVTIACLFYYTATLDLFDDQNVSMVFLPK